MNRHTLFLSSIFLLSSSILFTAQDSQQHQEDTLHFPEISLVSKARAIAILRAELSAQNYIKKATRYEKGIMQQLHQLESQLNQSLIGIWHAQTLIEINKKKNGSPQGLESLHKELDDLGAIKKLHMADTQALIQEPSNLEAAFKIRSQERDIYWYQALVLRAEKEEGLQREQTMQAQLTHKDAQIRDLQSALRQEEPGNLQLEGMPSPMPAASHQNT